MIRALLLIAATAPLAACASSDSLLVDRMGVSDAKYQSDLDACKKASPISLSLSNPVATCMQAKGYKVLMGKSNL